MDWNSSEINYPITIPMMWKWWQENHTKNWVLWLIPNPSYILITPKNSSMPNRSNNTSNLPSFLAIIGLCMWINLTLLENHQNLMRKFKAKEQVFCWVDDTCAGSSILNGQIRAMDRNDMKTQVQGLMWHQTLSLLFHSLQTQME
jgi:hypothetical protein